MKQVYLDNNATTRLDPMVLEAMMPFLTDFYGNPSSIHDFGLPAQAALERAHQQVAALLGPTIPARSSLPPAPPKPPPPPSPRQSP
jgi:cysteine desulfurase